MSRVGWASAVALILYFAVVESALSDIEEAGFLAKLYPAVRRTFEDAPLDDARLPNQHLFLLSTQEHTTQVFGPYVLHHLGRPMPRSFWTLSGAASAHGLQRISERTLRVSVLGGPARRGAIEKLYRDSGAPLRAGDRIQLPTATVTIIQTANQQPVMFDIELPKSADDPSYVFLYAVNSGLRRFSPPALGRSLTFSRAGFPVARW